MNIFVVDADPRAAAVMLCDQHVTKMVLESAQLLATACWHAGYEAPLRPTHPHHPCTLWVQRSRANYDWLLAHFDELLDEYGRRYGKVHRYRREALPDWFAAHLPSAPETALTPFAQAMPEMYRNPQDPVAAYRRFYQAEKLGFARWRHGPRPDWLNEAA